MEFILNCFVAYVKNYNIVILNKDNILDCFINKNYLLCLLMIFFRSVIAYFFEKSFVSFTIWNSLEFPWWFLLGIVYCNWMYQQKLQQYANDLNLEIKLISHVSSLKPAASMTYSIVLRKFEQYKELKKYSEFISPAAFCFNV